MRRKLVIILLALAAALTVFMFTGMQDDRYFRLAAPTPTLNAPKEKLKTDLSPQIDAMVAQGISATETLSASTILVAPRYTGVDNQGREWEITADKADQSSTADQTLMLLTNLQGAFKDPTRNLDLTLHADSGDFATATQLLNLKGNVVVSDSTLTFTAPAVSTRLDTREISGSGGVMLSGQRGAMHGTVRAAWFQLLPGATQVKLGGDVKGHLEFSKKERTR